MRPFVQKPNKAVGLANRLVSSYCCRAPPRSSHRAASAIIGIGPHPLARARPRSSRLMRAISVEPSMPPAPRPIRSTSETKCSRRPPSHDDTDVVGWRRVSCWWRRCALRPSSPAQRRILAATRCRRRPSPLPPANMVNSAPKIEP